ncbi:MAG: glycerol-3-phosphate dehydrogenase/oxidase, partial [Bacilli bacterium]
EINLVREMGRERAIMYKNAPHIVIPAPMMLPVFKKGTYGYLASSIGLYIYDWLAGVVRSERRKMLSKRETTQREPALKTDALKGSGYYFEYRTDDARLTLDVMKTAAGQGAHVFNYTEVTDFLYDDGKVVGVKVRDKVEDHHLEVKATFVVNAGGPWVDRIRELDDSLKGKRLFLTKGVHLVVDYKKLPVKQAIYFDTPDGRMIFVIPRNNITYIGTTDTAYDESIDSPQTTKGDRDYLLNAVNAMFPPFQLQPQDVQSNWAGLRPLIYEEGKGPSELSRKDEMIISHTGLITIAGGKLTGFRKMAEKVVDLVISNIKRDNNRMFGRCVTDQITISGGEHDNYPSYGEWKKVMIEKGRERGVSSPLIHEWIDTYGTNTMKVYQELDAIAVNTDESFQEKLLRAQIAYSIKAEMTMNTLDFLKLRTGWTYFNINKAKKTFETVNEIMATILNWDNQEKERQYKIVLEELERIQIIQ